MFTGILIGLVIGIMIPAPYDAIAKTYLGKAWAWIKAKFAGVA